MRRVVAASIFVLVAVVVAIACDDYGESPGSSGSSGTPDAAATTDAPVDSVAPADAGADVAPDAAPRPFCEDAGGRFCADFDGVATVNEGFTNVDTRNGATIVLDPTRSSSAPNSALFTVPADAGACTFAQLVRDLPGNFSSAELSFAAYVDLETTASPNFAAVEINLQCAIVVAPFGDGKRARVQHDPGNVSGDNVALARSLARAKWERVTLELRVNGIAPAVRIRIGSDVVGELQTLPASCSTAGLVRVQVGPHCIDGQATPTTLRIDDVLVNAN